MTIWCLNFFLDAKKARKFHPTLFLTDTFPPSRDEYDLIAAKSNYSTSYLSQDVAPKLWRLLTKILGEKVKKSNFREAVKRYWKANFHHLLHD